MTCDLVLTQKFICCLASSWEFLNFKQLFIGPQATAKVGIKILQDWQQKENELILIVMSL